MKDKNPGKTVMVEDSGKAGELQPESQGKADVAQTVANGTVIAPPLPGVERRFRQTDLPAHFIERRKHPRIRTEQPPVPAPPRFEDYGPIIGKPELDEIRFLARHLQGKTVKMVNSTAVGGGVA